MIPAAETALSDIETTRIEYVGGVIQYPKKTHLIISKDHERKKMHVFGPSQDSLLEGVDFLERSQRVVFHNGIGFDVPTLIQNFNLKIRDDKHFVDSLVCCRLFYSNIKEDEDFALFEKHKMRPASLLKFTGDLIGKHSLEAWGLRLKTPMPKGTYAEDMEAFGIDPWAEWNEKMQEYAIQDVEVLEALWVERLKDRFFHSTNTNAIAVEHYLAELMEQVKRSGIKFNREWALKVIADLEEHAATLNETIQQEFPPRLEPLKWEHRPIPLGMPDLDEELAKEYEEKCTSEDPADIIRCNEIKNSGPQQMITQLMWEHEKNEIYRPRFGLPEGYLREQWGVSFTPKVTRKVVDKVTKEVVYIAEKDSPFTKCGMVALNPNSRPQIARRLLEFGWIPEEFTDTGAPSLSEVELLKIEEQFPAARSIANYLLVQKRLGAISSGEKAWMNLLDEYDFIHPTIHACNTVAFRASHSDPNISQVPSVKMKDVLDENGNKVAKEVPKVKYTFNRQTNKWDQEQIGFEKKVKQEVLTGFAGKWGYDCRACFTVPEGFRMVGSDLAGIEMRAWAHYLWKFDDGAFADVVLNKDVHEENRVILGFNDRRKAKEWLYACVPMDTQALTKEGWKTHDQLRVGELIMTYNPTTGQKEWQPLLELVKYDDAEIMEISHTKGFNVRCTPNHRWFTKRRTGRKECYYADEVVTAENLTSEHAIIQNAPLAEHCREGADLDLDYKKYGTDWPKVILEASSLSRSAALLGFLLADGYHEQDGSWTWSQLKGGIAEGLLLASYMEWDNAIRVTDLDKAKNPMIRVRHSKKNFVTGQRLQKTMLPNEAVWCPRTANGSWVMRQGNTITITGNTMYGAGDEKLGFIIEPLATPARQKQLGAASRARFMAGLKGYEQLNDELMLGVRRGYLKGLDGRRAPVRKQHAALNTLLQSAGAIISKYWIIFVMDILENEHGMKWGYENDFTLLLYSHDELQFAVRPEFVEITKEACATAALKAGDYLDFRLPVEVGVDDGEHWGDTH